MTCEITGKAKASYVYTCSGPLRSAYSYANDGEALKVCGGSLRVFARTKRWAAQNSKSLELG